MRFQLSKHTLCTVPALEAQNHGDENNDVGNTSFCATSLQNLSDIRGCLSPSHTLCIPFDSESLFTVF